MLFEQFSKFSTSVNSTRAPIFFDSGLVTGLDFEVELTIVIGTEVPRNTKARDAMNYVAGFTVAHDVSARKWQLERNGGQWLLGKCMDGFAPVRSIVLF